MPRHDLPVLRAADRVGVRRDPLDRSVGVGAMVLRHVIELGVVPATCAFAAMRYDPLALEEDFQRAGIDPDVDLGPQVPIAHSADAMAA